MEQLPSTRFGKESAHVHASEILEFGPHLLEVRLDVHGSPSVALLHHGPLFHGNEEQYGCSPEPLQFALHQRDGRLLRARDARKVQLRAQLGEFLRDSELVVAQAYTPSLFDWRIGVLGGAPLYA